MSENHDKLSAEKRLDVALDGYTREIHLFWQRALFFWGLIAAAFVAYAAMLGKRQNLLLLISGFGMVCSIALSLANRGNKYWQEAWEQKVMRAEVSVTGPWVAVPEAPVNKGIWSGRKYSVGKLAIAISDYVSAVWILLFLDRILVAVGPLLSDRIEYECLRKFGTVVACLIPPAFVVLLLARAKSSPPNE